MKYEDLRSTIRTGDVLGYHGTEWTGRIIEFLTGKKDPTAWSHVALFYWNSLGLWLAQEYEGVGFGCYPASQLIGKFIREHGTCYLGRAPESVTGRAGSVLNFIAKYRVTPSLRPYGYGTLLRVLLDERTNPDNVQAVCSVFDQQAWEACGYVFPRLFAPEDFKTVVTEVVTIE
jgi:hypothetical protein